MSVLGAETLGVLPSTNTLNGPVAPPSLGVTKNKAALPAGIELKAASKTLPCESIVPMRGVKPEEVTLIVNALAGTRKSFT